MAVGAYRIRQQAQVAGCGRSNARAGRGIGYQRSVSVKVDECGEEAGRDADGLGPSGKVGNGRGARMHLALTLIRDQIWE